MTSSFPRLAAADWLRIAGVLIAAWFGARAIATLTRLLGPVTPDAIETVLALLTLVTAGAIIAGWSLRVWGRERAARVWVGVQGVTGAALALWLLVGLARGLGDLHAFESDRSCLPVLAGGKATAGACRTGVAKVVAMAIAGTPGQRGPLLGLSDGGPMRVVELDCPGMVLVAETAQGAGKTRYLTHGSPIVAVAAGSLLCQTTFAPSSARLTRFTVLALFGLVAAAAAVYRRWGDRIRAWWQPIALRLAARPGKKA